MRTCPLRVIISSRAAPLFLALSLRRNKIPPGLANVWRKTLSSVLPSASLKIVRAARLDDVTSTSFVTTKLGITPFSMNSEITVNATRRARLRRRAKQNTTMPKTPSVTDDVTKIKLILVLQVRRRLMRPAKWQLLQYRSPSHFQFLQTDLRYQL